MKKAIKAIIREILITSLLRNFLFLGLLISMVFPVYTQYPMKHKAEQINLQSRIMAVADIFEALSAPDRLYKKPISLSKAIKILELMVKDNHIDKDVVELLIKSELVTKYANQYLTQNQLDG